MDTTTFVRDGFVAIRGAIDAAVIAACRDQIWDTAEKNGQVRRNDRDTWTEPMLRIRCPSTEPFIEAANSPALATAYDELIGVGRWHKPHGMAGALMLRLPSESPASDVGFHIDGSWLGDNGQRWTSVHSKGRGLLALVLFSDVSEDDAPTRLIPGSHLYLPPVLAPAGEAGMAIDTVLQPLHTVPLTARHAVDATGKAGDVFLCHPFLIHTATWPHRGGEARMVANHSVGMDGGFELDGSDPSPVAQAIVAGLSTTIPTEIVYSC
jgi:ectoine hydroxylase-related dioxygenase (phytanoyl-CoA dioxygenase family)